VRCDSLGVIAGAFLYCSRTVAWREAFSLAPLGLRNRRPRPHAIQRVGVRARWWVRGRLGWNAPAILRRQPEVNVNGGLVVCGRDPSPHLPPYGVCVCVRWCACAGRYANPTVCVCALDLGEPFQTLRLFLDTRTTSCRRPNVGRWLGISTVRRHREKAPKSNRTVIRALLKAKGTPPPGDGVQPSQQLRASQQPLLQLRDPLSLW